MGASLGIGVEVGWLGFPAIESYTLCFFSGIVSARQEQRKAYFIDGVAINGVSGGPVLYLTETEGVQIVGSVSQYRVNRATGEALPGLLIAQDVSHFHDVFNHVRSITTSFVAQSLGRDSLGIEVEEEYVKIGLRRLAIQESYNGEVLRREPKTYEQQDGPDQQHLAIFERHAQWNTTSHQ